MRIQTSPIFICSLFFLFVVSAYSQEPRIKKKFTNSTHWAIVAITQDKLGYIWFASPGSGVTRYDGKEFTTIQSISTDTNSLSSNNVTCMLFDTLNIMWVGLGGMGLDRFDIAKNRFTHYRHDEKDSSTISSDTVTCVLEDRSGNLWVGTNKGLNRLDRKTGRFTRYINEPGVATSLSFNEVASLYEDKQGTIWVGCGFPNEGASEEDGGLNKFDRTTDRFTRYKSDPDNPNSLANNKVGALFEDSKGNFWVGTAGDGLHIMDRARGTFKRFPYDPKKPVQLSRPPIVSPSNFDPILFITEDPQGGIWISTLLGGINRYDPNTNKVDLYGKSSAADFDANKVLSLDPKKRLDDFGFLQAFKANDNSLWFSTVLGSLYNLNFNYTTLPFYDDSGREAYSFYLDTVSKMLWVGTNKGLMQKTADGRLIKTFTHDPNNSNSIPHDYIQAMRGDKRGRLWMAPQRRGLTCFDPATGLFTNYENVLNDPSSLKGASVIETLAFDNKDRLWIGSDLMIERLDNDKGVFKHYMHSDKDTNTICQCNPYAIYPDNATGNMWIATNSGAERLDPVSGSVTHFLKNKNCRAVFVDHERVTWVGNNNILFRMKPGETDFSVFEYPFADNSGGDGILHIMEDDLHNLWVTTGYALLQINAARTAVKRFAENYGIRPNEFTWADNFKTADGKLYFGNRYGYHAFYPDQLPPNPPPPALTFSSFRLNEKEIIPGESSVLLSPIWKTKEIMLNHNQNVFSLDFISQNYHSDKPNRYYYMLENYDSKWHSLENSHKAIFVNVPPGKYIFHARVVTDEGSVAEKTLNINIAPPWWKTKWAYAFYIIAFLVIAFIANRIIRNRIIEKERARSREKELLQAKEIEKAYTKLKTTQAQLIQSEKMASLGQLTAGIAHEIQNPLNFVNNFSEINNELIEELKSQRLKLKNEEQNELLNDIFRNNEKINHHGKRADSIVKGMLQHSRANTGQKELTDINNLADEYLRLAYHGMRAREKSLPIGRSGFNAAIETDFDTTIGAINISAQDIGRVLLNLYNNAFDAMNEKFKLAIPGYAPVIKVQSRKAGDKIEIIITDNGNGVAPAIIDKIFQPFFTTKPSGQGTGLGLSMSYDIVKAYGGELKVETKEGEGSEFTFSLPII